MAQITATSAQFPWTTVARQGRREHRVPCETRYLAEQVALSAEVWVDEAWIERSPALVELQDPCDY